MLQVHGRFGPASSGPLILNAFIVVFAGYFLIEHQTAGPAAAYVLGAATVLSGFTQCLWFARLLRRHAAWRGDWRPARPRAMAMLRRFGPVALGLGTLQLNSFLDMLIAMYPTWIGATILGYAYPLDERSNIILTAAQRLYQFPLGVFGIAVATAIFPMLARFADEPDNFLDTLRRGIRLSLFIGAPASVGLAMVRSDMVSVLYSGGDSGFSDDGVVRTAAALLAYAPGIWIYSLNHLFTRAFYATGDTRTPMLISTSMVAVNLVGNMLLIFFLREAGLAWSTTACAGIQMLVLAYLTRRLLRRQRHAWAPAAATHDVGADEPLLDRATLGSIWRTLSAAVLMGATVYGVGVVIGPREGWGGHAAGLIAAAGSGMVVFLATARVMGSQELRTLMNRGR